MDTLPVWKRVYPIIASSNPHVTITIIEDVVDICKAHLSDVLLPYQFYTKESFVKWKNNLKIKEIVSDDEMCNFIHKLSKELDLDASVAWKIICNFLMYEYYGKVDELKSLIKFDSKIEYLAENIWYFYTADRMFLLKTLRHVLENVEETNNPTLQQKMDSLRKTMNANVLWKNLINIFANSIQEINKDKISLVPTDLLPEWIHRNNREQVELVLLLMHTLNLPDMKLIGSELEEVLVLCVKHGFTRLPFYTESIHISRKEDLAEIRNAEIALVLTILHKYWTSHGKIKIKMLPQNVERSLGWQHMQSNHSIVLFAWNIFKTYYDKNSTDDVTLEYCNTMVQKMCDKEVFMSIYELLTHRMFVKSEAGSILADAIHTLLVEFLKICSDHAFMTEQSGVPKITAALLRRKGLVVLENLTPIYQMSMEAFPFVFEPFLDMCSSLLMIPEKYDQVIKLLREIPAFLAEIPWKEHRDKFVLTKPQKLFMDNDLFVIPAGATVERFLYQGNEFTRFLHPFSFFSLMEEFIMSFSTITFEIGPGWHSYKNLSQLVLIGYKFINHLLKHYKGDYRSNSELRTLVKRLDIVPVQFCEGPAKSLEFVKLFFSINCTLITREFIDYMEVFPPVQRKKFMPTVTNYAKENRHTLFGTLDTYCYLFKNLKEEEESRTHSLLIDYLKLVHFMVKKNIYHCEVQLPGVWYMIYCTFPLYHNFYYDDPSEQTEISKYCFLIFIEVLQRHLSTGNESSAAIYEMVIDSFLHEDIIMNSYKAKLPQEKFYLQNLMERESDWRRGQALEEIECLRLQFVVLLLLFKHKSKLESKRDTLVNNDGFFAYGVTPYIINPYSLALRKLSCRFLEVLARDRNIPLMALLGLDYDQVQRLYLDRLRDSIEDDDLKLHILDLIGTCIVYQHGMTAAFFNFKRSRKWYSDNKEKTIEVDTVKDFMIDYLQNIKRSPAFLRSPLQLGMLHVMASLWTTGKQHLIDDVIGLKEFWSLLSHPLYRAFDQSPKVYAYIFQIYRIQLNELETDEKFVKSVEKFLTDDKQVKVWIDYIRTVFGTITSNIDRIEDRKFLLKSCMKFIIIVEKCGKIKHIADLNKFQFITMSLDGIGLPLVNTHCVGVWMDFLLLQISYWNIPTEKDKLFKIAEGSVNLLKIIRIQYIDLNHSTRLTTLTVIQYFLEKLRGNFEQNSNHLLTFLEQFGTMFEHEYNLLEKNEWKTLDGFDFVAREQMLPWMICVRIVNGLFEYKNIEQTGVWFTYRNVLDKFMNCTCELLKNPVTVPLVKMLMHGIALYAQSAHYFDFLTINMNNFFGKVEPFVIRLLLDPSNKAHPLKQEEAWVICSLLLKILTSYFQSLQVLTLPCCYNFITLNEHIFHYTFNLLETSVTPKALDLVQNTLLLIDSMFLKWRLEWYRKSNTTYNFVVSGVKKVINECLYALLRPKNIVIYALDEKNRLHQLEKYPVDLMVAIMNRLVTVAGLASSILYKINPDLINLLDVPLSDTMTIIIENDFSVPTFELPISNKLTYGMLLCLSHFLCKTIDTLNMGKNSAPVKVESEEYLSRYFGTVEHQDFTHNMPTQKLSAFLRYAMYEYSGLADPWIQKLDFNLVRFSLESLMLFLAQQIFLALKAESENSTFFRRNLSSELQFFYEHIKKTASILISTESVDISQIRSETDILKKYLVHHKERNKYDEVADNNFCMIISYWFIHVCKLR